MQSAMESRQVTDNEPSFSRRVVTCGVLHAARSRSAPRHARTIPRDYQVTVKPVLRKLTFCFSPKYHLYWPRK